jgi:NAD-dependent dihydropyrimidine dehydrogenase PreA subunit
LDGQALVMVVHAHGQGDLNGSLSDHILVQALVYLLWGQKTEGRGRTLTVRRDMCVRCRPCGREIVAVTGVLSHEGIVR